MTDIIRTRQYSSEYENKESPSRFGVEEAADHALEELDAVELGERKV
jgi:hypothetical protein